MRTIRVWRHDIVVLAVLASFGLAACGGDDNAPFEPEPEEPAPEEPGPDFDFSGDLIAFESNRDGNREIHLMTADGSNPIRITNDPGRDIEPVWVSGGTQIVFFSNRSGSGDVWIMDADGSDPLNLTDDPSFNCAPPASPSAHDRFPEWRP